MQQGIEYGAILDVPFVYSSNGDGFLEHDMLKGTEPYYFQAGDKQPRYYQRNAINRTIEAIAKGQNRILLVMATGVGKTYVAFNIIYRLWKSRRKKKILFLADRNILVDQTRQNDFSPFSKVMTKIENRTIDSSYEVYL